MKKLNTLIAMSALLGSCSSVPAIITEPVSETQEIKVNTIAAVIILEAGGEGTNGMQAVTEVIYNRAVIIQGLALKQGKAVNIVDAQYAVVTTKKQFSCLNTQSAAEAVTKARSHRQYNFAQRLVYDTMAGKVSSLTSNINHYCRFDCYPKWRDDSKMTVKIRNHVFFKL